MIVDSSALVAILLGEAESLSFARALQAAPVKLIAAPTYLETCMVMVRRSGVEARQDVDDLMRRSEIQIVPFTPQAASLAVSAFLNFGKGRHPANLNFGDCISYAMTKTELMPLLFKGDDFRLTDVESAL